MLLVLNKDLHVEELLRQHVVRNNKDRHVVLLREVLQEVNYSVDGLNVKRREDLIQEEQIDLVVPLS